MKELIQNKLMPLEREIAKEKGDFELFGLFLRENSPGKWDLVVAAPWISRDEGEALRFLSQELNRVLTTPEVVSLSRIVILDAGNPLLESLLTSFEVEHGITEFKRRTIDGLSLKRGFVVTSLRRQPANENRAKSKKS